MKAKKSNLNYNQLVSRIIFSYFQVAIFNKLLFPAMAFLSSKNRISDNHRKAGQAYDMNKKGDILEN